MSPQEAKEFGLIDKVLEQVPKPGSEDQDASPVTEKSDQSVIVILAKFACGFLSYKIWKTIKIIIFVSQNEIQIV